MRSRLTIGFHRRFYQGVLPAACVLALGVLHSGNAVAAPTFTVLHSFTGLDGSNPNGKLVFDAAGSIYGTTFDGGTSGMGTVFELRLNGNGVYLESPIYNFQGLDDGGNPTAGLVMDANGALYGTASTSNGAAIGNVFQLTPPVGGGTTWTFNVIHAFGTGKDGAFPNCDLIFGSKGALYGTTVEGGAHNRGTVFELTPPAIAGGTWTEAVIYSFVGPADGGLPYAGLAFDSKGNLIGTATDGGTGKSGTVFQLTKPAAQGGTWSETTLYSFTGLADGKHPLAGVLVGAKGSIFGTTFLGGSNNGVVYELTPQKGGGYVESVLWAFTGSDGANPSDVPVEDSKGNFYGTTGGAVAGTNGNVFKLTHGAGSTFTEAVLHDFSKTDGQTPLASLVKDKSGALFGTTFYGGTTGAGVVFQIK